MPAPAIIAGSDAALTHRVAAPIRLPFSRRRTVDGVAAGWPERVRKALRLGVRPELARRRERASRPAREPATLPR